MEIKTERLLLRPLRAADAADLFEVFRDPRAMKYWSSLPFTDLAQMQTFIRETIEADPRRTADFAIEYKGRAIGKAGFWTIPEIGYILHPDHWRKGFGAEALQAVIAYGFEDLGLDHITADVDPDNLASAQLLTRLGFRETGRARNTIEIGGTWFHSVYFRLDKGISK